MRLVSSLVVAATMLAPVARAQAPATKPATKAAPVRPAVAPTLATDQDKTFYALGLSIGRSLDVFALTPAELEVIRLGIADAVFKQPPKAELEKYGPRIQALAQSRASVRSEAEKRLAMAFVEKSAGEPGARKLPSGMVYVEVAPGTGPSPTATDVVKLHYRGTLADGKEFDSSYKRGQPAEFALSGVVACFTDGVTQMKVGGKAKLVCPPGLAYGDRGAPPDIPGGAALIFEIELLEIVKK